MEIGKFWGFPSLESDITIENNRKGAKIGKSFYTFPILLRISDTLEVNPFFEVKLQHFETPKLFNYLQEFQDNDTFLWIDKCSRVASLGEAIDVNAKLCFAIGKLGSTLEMGVLNKEKVFSLHAIQEQILIEATHEKALLRKEGLAQIIEK
jgi:phosphoglycerol transferase